MTDTFLTTGPRGGILHVNRQFIAMNKRDGGNRPVFTLKPNGPSSTAVYCRNAFWSGETSAVGDDDPLACGAVAWIKIAPDTPMRLIDAMTFMEAKNYENPDSN